MLLACELSSVANLLKYDLTCFMKLAPSTQLLQQMAQSEQTYARSPLLQVSTIAGRHTHNRLYLQGKVLAKYTVCNTMI